MSKVIKILYTTLLAAVMILPSYANAQSLRETARKAKQEIAEKRKKEQARYDKVIDSKDKKAYQSFLSDYPNSKHKHEINCRIAEIDLWENARSKNTVEAYQNYLAKTQLHWYDTTANSAVTSILKARDKGAWDDACASGSITAFSRFINEHTQSPYVAEAEENIMQLKANEAWCAAEQSGNLADYERFAREFPKATQAATANNKIHELKGREYYDKGLLNEAYSEFCKVEQGSLSSENQAAYTQCCEYISYSILGSYSSEDALNGFINSHPNSVYVPEVKNYLAIVKARNMQVYATEYTYNQIRALVTDGKTRQTVENYISANRNNQRRLKRIERSLEREKNGGLLNIGLKFIDFGWNGKGSGENMICYDLGLYLRIGNYADRVQFSVGLEPGLVAYNEDYIYSYTEDMTVAFHMPVSAHLKLNLFKMGDPARFFVFGKYQYNAVRAENAEAKQAWSAGFGFSWKHFDWSFYYRQDMGKPEKSGGYTSDSRPHFFGTTMTAYWKL